MSAADASAVAHDMINHVRDCAEILEKLLEAAPRADASNSYLYAGAKMVVTRLDAIANNAQDTLNGEVT